MTTNFIYQLQVYEKEGYYSPTKEWCDIGKAVSNFDEAVRYFKKLVEYKRKRPTRMTWMPIITSKD